MTTLSDIAARLDAVEARPQHRHCPYCQHPQAWGKMGPIEYHDCKEGKMPNTKQDKAPDAGDEATISALMKIVYYDKGLMVHLTEAAARAVRNAIRAGMVPDVCLTIHSPGKIYEGEIAKLRARVAELEKERDGFKELVPVCERLEKELAAERERAESAIAETNRLSNQYNEMQKAGSIDHLRKLNKEANEARAELNNARTLTEATRQDLVKARIERDEARAEADAAKDMLWEARKLLHMITNTAGMGFNGGIYERMAVADAETIKRINAFLAKCGDI